jgi:hypothetical protein
VHKDSAQGTGLRCWSLRSPISSKYDERPGYRIIRQPALRSGTSQTPRIAGEFAPTPFPAFPFLVVRPSGTPATASRPAAPAPAPPVRLHLQLRILERCRTPIRPYRGACSSSPTNTTAGFQGSRALHRHGCSPTNRVREILFNMERIWIRLAKNPSKDYGPSNRTPG